MTQAKPVVWTVAGSDCGGGAGIQADLRSFADLSVHGCSAITAVTAQSAGALHNVFPADAGELAAQLDALRTDLAPTAIKVGQLPTSGTVTALRRVLDEYDGFVVLDPVILASDGRALVDAAVTHQLRALFDRVSLLTPNLAEAEHLTGLHIAGPVQQEKAGRALIADGARAALIKGGHSAERYCRDFFCDAATSFWLTNPRQSGGARGTGCVLSSAVAAFVAHGKALRDALVLANAYVQQGLRLKEPFGQDHSIVAQGGWPAALEDYPQVSSKPESIDLSAFPPCETQRLGLYPIVDSVEWLRRLLPLGIKTIQLRIKNAEPGALGEAVAEASALGRAHGARLFINDHWQLAIHHGAYGVHLGQEDLDAADLVAIRRAGLRLGISTHSEFEWARAATLRPSYIALGTVFPTQTKPAQLIGTENLARWVRVLGAHFPLTAIGGIKHHNIDRVLISGVGSIAVATAITEAADYVAETEALLAAVNRSA